MGFFDHLVTPLGHIVDGLAADLIYDTRDALTGGMDQGHSTFEKTGIACRLSSSDDGCTLRRQLQSVDADEFDRIRFQPLLDPVDLKGKIVTADALHTQVEHATYLKEQKEADYFFTVKGNQGTLLKSIEDLDDEVFSP